MKRRHSMPFGAELTGNGTRFRLWAPAAARVDVELDAAGRRDRRTLQALEGGWFELFVEGIGAGVRYAYRIDGGQQIPDPASRCNPDDVHHPSMVVDPGAYDWIDANWRGRRWEEAVIYELHVGTFTPEGTFAAARERLDGLRQIGITAIELMPLADFPGRRNWGYDGVLLFAPESTYGTPEELKSFVDAAHQLGMMVLLDVVYNHFGPEGNYLHLYAPQFFTDRHETPWGAAINFDGPGSRTVRDFYLNNAQYWLDEFHVDGLRLDAVHAIFDDSEQHIVSELAAVVRRHSAGRYVHLVLENDHNEARYLVRDAHGGAVIADAQWSDDVHHSLHVITTGETDGYYADYADQPVRRLGRCLAEGFAYQGERSAFRGGARRGEPSGQLPPSSFVVYTQTHDQVGNRARGERLSMLADADALRQAVAIVLLSPSVPMLFMGEEFAASSPFLFFCDFGPELAAAVTSGRRNEFSRFERYRDPALQAAIPDPNDLETFRSSRLDWSELVRTPHAQWCAFYASLLRTRAAHITPLLDGTAAGGSWEVEGHVLRVDWLLAGGSSLHLIGNFGDPESALLPTGRLIHLQRAVLRDVRQHIHFEAHGLAVVLAQHEL